MTQTQPINVNKFSTHATILPPPPPEDKYAALKDLDNALKSQSTIDWNSGSSSNNSSIYSTPASGNSAYNSPMSQGSSIYGSPSQGA